MVVTVLGGPEPESQLRLAGIAGRSRDLALLRRGGPNLAADWPIGPCVYFSDISDRPIVDPLFHKADVLGRMALIAHLGLHPVASGRFGDSAGLVHRMSQRFLAKDMFTCFHGPHGDDRVRVIRRGDDNCVDVLLLVEHLAIVGVDFRLGIGFIGWSSVVVINVAPSHNVFFFALAKIGRSHPADPDPGDIQLFAGRRLAGTGDYMPRNDLKAVAAPKRREICGEIEVLS